MDFKSLLWTFFLIPSLLSQVCWSVSVHFLSSKPQYVAKGETLTLHAKIDIRTMEMVVREVVWIKVSNNPKTSETVATYPGPVKKGRRYVEEQGATLKITNFVHADSGVYIINVTDHQGHSAAAQQAVEEYLAVYHVSVMVNVSHTSLHCREAWGTDPVFSWLHEKAKIDGSLGHLSDDNSTLYVTSPLCGHYTCMVSNRLGYSSATYVSDPCERKGNAGTVAVVCLFLLLIGAGALLFLLWRRRQMYKNRGERLRESYDGPL